MKAKFAFVAYRASCSAVARRANQVTRLEAQPLPGNFRIWLSACPAKILNLGAHSVK